MAHPVATNADLADALAALDARDDAASSRHLERAARQGSIMGRAIRDVLDDGNSRNAYDKPRAFELFVRGGGNLALYEAVSAELAKLYDALRPSTLLDIGAGDGMALVPAIEASGHVPDQIDVVEPNDVLLGKLIASLPLVRGYRMTMENFAEGFDDEDHWDLAQSTFALQSIETKTREQALAALAGHVDRLVIVEFDVPDLTPNSDAYYQSLAHRYERAASEYSEDAALVAGGFLAPMLLGQLRSIAPSNHEQPADAWVAELERAGYRVLSRANLHDYSWSTAFSLTAAPKG
ncbi:hypothetical protein GUF72_21520 [Xanthomonas citri pv. citri]|nr:MULTISPECIES: hypothetical protein [Xanthomonas]AGI09773.1 Hypothetical Protein XCAW_04008 [Xanthomonas citri subsp. citri Aw12879]AKM26212.1 hypothetical protein AB890_16500 [Xanthomonas citri pv. citri]APR10026.1 hypothetical protein BI314_07395 [Xanthomonas citri pv. citri]APR14728.1 hypothetical protein BI315_07500 [Xanthomonas citri pv. citri]APR21279.1 hypothetical protein BI316_18885 [Xanthomonas citri pv. citri]